MNKARISVINDEQAAKYLHIDEKNSKRTSERYMDILASLLDGERIRFLDVGGGPGFLLLK